MSSGWVNENKYLPKLTLIQDLKFCRLVIGFAIWNRDLGLGTRNGDWELVPWSLKWLGLTIMMTRIWVWDWGLRFRDWHFWLRIAGSDCGLGLGIEIGRRWRLGLDRGWELVLKLRLAWGLGCKWDFYHSFRL